MTTNYNLLTFFEKKNSGKIFRLKELTEIERFCTAWNLANFFDSFVAENCYKELEGNEFTKKFDSTLKSLGIHIYSLRYIDWKHKQRKNYVAAMVMNKLDKKFENKKYPRDFLYAVPYKQLSIK